MEDNLRRSIRQRGFPARLQDCELFQDNKINDDGDFVHFALMVEYEPVKTKEPLSDPKWICDMKGELKSIEFYKSKNGLLMHQRRYAIEIFNKFKIEHCNVVITPVEPRPRRMRMRKMLIQLSIRDWSDPCITCAIHFWIWHLVSVLWADSWRGRRCLTWQQSRGFYDTSKVLLDAEVSFPQWTRVENAIYSILLIPIGAEIKMIENLQLDTSLCSEKHQSLGVRKMNQ